MKKQAKKRPTRVARDELQKVTRKIVQRNVRRVAKAIKAEREPQPPPQKAIALPSPLEKKALDSEALTLASKAKALVVSNPEQEMGAVQFGSNLKGLEKKIVEFWKRIIDPVKGLYDELREQRDEHLLPVTESMNLVKSKLTDYYKERDRAAAEAAAAENKQREHRSFDEAKAEAMKLIKAGKIDEASQLLRDAKTQYSEVIPERIVPTTGAQRREQRDVEVFDAKLVPDKYWEINMVMLRDDVLGRNGQKPIKVPGVRITGKPGVALRAAQEA